MDQVERIPEFGKNLSISHGITNLFTPAEQVEQFKQTLARAHQVHGDHLLWVDSAGPQTTHADALATTVPGLAVGVFTADCVPLLIAGTDCHQQVLGVMAIHAGWKGTAAKIASKAIESFVARTKCAALHTGIGPCISYDRFEVGVDVLTLFPDAIDRGLAKFFRHDNGQEKYLLNLAKINELQVQNTASQLGIAASIFTLGHCTFSEKTRYPSYRRGKGTQERILSFICFSK